MWIFLSDSFLSIVGAPQNCLLVRARRKGDIERVFPDAKVTRTPKRDYAYRATIPRKIVAKALANEASTICYSNFKDSVPKAEHERHMAYLRVWATMEGFQKPRKPFWSDHEDALVFLNQRGAPSGE